MVSWPTGFNPVIAVEPPAAGAWSGTGALAPEALDRIRMALLDHYCIHHAMVEMDLAHTAPPDPYTGRVVADTRFAQAPAGPVAYRLDGEGERWLIVVGDRTDPYGPPGPAGYDAFVSVLAARGWRILTVLDGRRPGATGPQETGADRRVAAIQAVVEDVGATAATVLGVAGGASGGCCCYPFDRRGRTG